MEFVLLPRNNHRSWQPLDSSTRSWDLCLLCDFICNFFLIPFHWQSHPRKKHSVQLCLSLIANSPKRLLVIEISLWHQELFLPAMRVTRSHHLPIISASAHHVPRCLRPCVECPLPDVARYSFHSNCAPTMCHALWWKNHVGHKILVHQEHLIF